MEVQPLKGFSTDYIEQLIREQVKEAQKEGAALREEIKKIIDAGYTLKFIYPIDLDNPVKSIRFIPKTT